jgi:hypothetical protein
LYTRTLNFGGETDSTELPTHLANCLRSVQASAVRVEGSSVQFRGGVFRFVSSWNVLGPFGFGNLTVDANSRQVQYTLSLRQLFFVTTALTVFLAIFVLVEWPSWGAVVFIPLVWTWMFGGNLVNGIPRFETFLGHSIETAPRLKR